MKDDVVVTNLFKIYRLLPINPLYMFTIEAMYSHMKRSHSINWVLKINTQDQKTGYSLTTRGSRMGIQR